MSKQYDYKALIETFITAQQRNYIHPDFENYYKGLLVALEDSFMIKLSIYGTRTNRPLWMYFQSTVLSYVSIRTPTEGYLEASLIERTLDEMGNEGTAIRRQLDSIYELTKMNKAAHSELLYMLFKALYGEIDTLVTSEELLAHGFDDSKEPKQWDSKYDDYR